MKVGKRISDGSSVYSREMLTIVIALQWIEDNWEQFFVQSSSSNLRYRHSTSRPDISIELQHPTSTYNNNNNDIIQDSNDGTECPISTNTRTFWNQRKWINRNICRKKPLELCSAVKKFKNNFSVNNLSFII